MQKERLDTARVFERIFSTYRAQARVLLPAAALLYLLPSALGVSGDSGAQVLQIAASLIAGVWYQGMVVQAVRDIQDGVRDLAIGGLFRSVGKVLGPLLWTAILLLLGIFAGLLLFIIPGLVLLTWWAVAAPVVVCEVRSPPEALRRSRELVRGHGWRVFSVLLVTVVIILIIQLAIISVVAAIADSDAGFAVANLIASILTAPLFALASAVLYLELLQLKGEPLPPADMASFTGRRER